MKKNKPPNKDSIQKLAAFWDSHDLTDFEEELDEVPEELFVRGTSIKVPLQASEATAVRQLAEAKGVSQGQLIRTWVLQRLARGKAKRQAGR